MAVVNFSIPFQKRKTVYVWAGPNGSGKSFLWELVKPAQNIKHIDADAIEKKIKDNPEMAHSTATAQIAARYAGKEILSALENGNSYVIETTLDTNKPGNIVARNKSYGFETSLVYIITPSIQDCLKNVGERVKHDGHDVPQDTVTRRYWKSLKNFGRMCGSVAEWRLVFNDGQNYSLVAQSVNGKAEYVAQEFVPLLPQELQNVLPQLVPNMCH